MLPYDFRKENEKWGSILSVFRYRKNILNSKIGAISFRTIALNLPYTFMSKYGNKLQRN